MVKISDKDELSWIRKNEPWRILDHKLKRNITPTEQELYDLTKVEQVKILNERGIKIIPKYEKDRVEKIMKIMTGGD